MKTSVASVLFKQDASSIQVKFLDFKLYNQICQLTKYNTTRTKMGHSDTKKLLNYKHIFTFIGQRIKHKNLVSLFHRVNHAKNIFFFFFFFFFFLFFYFFLQRAHQSSFSSIIFSPRGMHGQVLQHIHILALAQNKNLCTFLLLLRIIINVLESIIFVSQGKSFKESIVITFIG